MKNQMRNKMKEKKKRTTIFSGTLRSGQKETTVEHRFTKEKFENEFEKTIYKFFSLSLSKKS